MHERALAAIPATTTQLPTRAVCPRFLLIAEIGKRALSGIVCILKMPRNAQAAAKAHAKSPPRMTRSQPIAATVAAAPMAASTEPATPCWSFQPTRAPQKKTVTSKATTIQLVFMAMPVAKATVSSAPSVVPAFTSEYTLNNTARYVAMIARAAQKRSLLKTGNQTPLRQNTKTRRSRTLRPVKGHRLASKPLALSDGYNCAMTNSISKR
mmetsp:Transcript_55792/g.169819  ORF Transcript_55792/g.169819 Transcript_55792/m.169819 type:complete len:210 (-) Transcript_55792:266-895(-)